MNSPLAEAEFQAVGFFLADHAAVESGKLYVNGGFWNRLALPTFPTPAAFSVVVVLQVPWRARLVAHKFEVLFLDADGRAMPNRFEGEFHVGAGAELSVGEPSLIPFALPVTGLMLERAGAYVAIFEVDGMEMARWRFQAVSLAA